ncbi:hypothetical protein BOX15_Mlig028413g1 [Macrostomum lignano]|uniref:Palmitoyltransferase n=1 Tax=Macrostomum lignano TaxID=282301 RepID=A0A267GYH4_9PLAT|nr:hypothetical protein BOX15_Mlig028413g1 [Macrostomum lignano]
MERALSLNLLNAAGVVYFFGVTAACFFTADLLVLPRLSADGDLASPGCVRLLLYCVIAEVLANYFAVLRTSRRNSATSTAFARTPASTNGSSTVLGYSGLANAEFCLHCRAKRPPGAHHCPLCRVCVLGHDHHCFFTACCIGRCNRRHFLPLMLHVLLGSSLCVCLQYLYLARVFQPALSVNIWMYFYPITVVLYATGNADASVVAMVTLLFATLFGVLASFYFFFFQLLLVCRGQTPHEFAEVSAPKMSLGSCRRNCARVFGRCGLLQFLWPCPALPMPEDFARPAKTA